MPDHTAKTVTDISLSSIIYKNDKLNKAKHYIITYIEHVKNPQIEKFAHERFMTWKNGKNNLTTAKYAKRNRQVRIYWDDIKSRALLSAWGKALCSTALLVRCNSYKTALFM